jgi:hypothetical protein
MRRTPHGAPTETCRHKQKARKAEIGTQRWIYIYIYEEDIHKV